MDQSRRTLTKNLALAIGIAGGLLKLSGTLAASWNKVGFESKAVADALKAIGASAATPSRDIVISAPDIAENGGQVPITISSKIPNTQSISIVVSKNPFPLNSTFHFANGAEGYVSTKIKMDQTSNVVAIVQADGRFFSSAKEVKVTIGGCAA